MTSHASSDHPAPSAALRELRRLNALFIDNFVRNDVSSHDAILHPEFIYIRSNGGRVDRATYLRKWAKGFDPQVIRYWDVRDELITIIGDVALVRATNKEVVRRDGREVAAMSTYTDTYIHEAGGWKCIQAQITPVAKQHEPGDETIISVYINGVKQETRP